MGIPQHFSLEVPQRCLTLLDELWPDVEGVYHKRSQRLGPLTTTFLLAMAYPILNLPIERIGAHLDKSDHEDYADDRRITPELTSKIRNVFGNAKLETAPFIVKGVWSYVRIPRDRLFNLADGIPPEVAKRLAEETSLRNAESMKTLSWAQSLRNALAHGGVAYLDAKGEHTHEEQPAKMFAFVSGEYEYGVRPHKLVGMKILRVTERDFKDFLRRWVGWLSETSAVELMKDFRTEPTLSFYAASSSP